MTLSLACLLSLANKHTPKHQHKHNNAQTNNVALCLACQSAVGSVAMSRSSRFVFAGCGSRGWPMLIPHDAAVDTHHAVVSGYGVS